MGDAARSVGRLGASTASIRLNAPNGNDASEHDIADGAITPLVRGHVRTTTLSFIPGKRAVVVPAAAMLVSHTIRFADPQSTLQAPSMTMQRIGTEPSCALKKTSLKKAPWFVENPSPTYVYAGTSKNGTLAWRNS